MAASKYDADTRARALEVYAAEGSAAAEAETGVPANTVRSWARRAGVASSSDSRRARVEAAHLTLSERRANLASGLLDDAERLRAQLFRQTDLWSFASGNEHRSPGWYEQEVPRPPAADQLAMMKALDVAVKNLQLLTGEATERSDSTGLDLEAELAAYQQGMADRAALEAERAEQPAP